MFKRKRPAPHYPPAPPRRTLYVVGDIHGCDHLLAKAHQEIDADITPESGDVTEIYLGDYVDRGPYSADVIDRLIRRSTSRATVCLRGNHEDIFLKFLDGEVSCAAWSSIGGAQTIRSYGLDAAGLSDEEVRQALTERMPAAHLAFLKGLAASASIGAYFFAHAGARPGVDLKEQSEQDLMWIRDEFLSSDQSFGQIVVHGHTPASAPEFRANRINLDTGAFMTGVLTCLRIGATGARLVGG